MRYIGVKKWASALLFIGCITALLSVSVEFFWVQPDAELTRLKPKIEPKDYLAQRLALRVATAQALGSVTLLVGIFLTWKSLGLTQSNLEVARRALKINTDAQEANLAAAHHKQMTELLSKAVEQLGHAQSGVRIGALFILERIAQESPVLDQPIVKMLVAYIRSNAPWSGGTGKNFTEREDLQAAIYVLTRRSASTTQSLQVDLSNTDLRGIDLGGINLSDSSLRNSNLTGAKLTRAVLARADLSDALLNSAELTEVVLTSASLFRASLEEACCEGANFIEARLYGANLRRANLQKCNFSQAVLAEANMEFANCWSADFSGAALHQANAEGADLRQAKLTKTGLRGVKLGSARLAGTLLKEIDFTRTDLAGADLERCDLSNGNLSLARLVGASLRSTVLTGADFTGAELAAADFTGATGLATAKVTKEQLLQAILDPETKQSLSIQSDF